ncbi:MAG: hypothetical protein Q4B51_01540, partial [Coriobacteriaceae bacterium]|nr:hypothetical protein [Coriobacteriaceae bacterium]
MHAGFRGSNFRVLLISSFWASFVGRECFIALEGRGFQIARTGGLSGGFWVFLGFSFRMGKKSPINGEFWQKNVGLVDKWR